ncbi:TAXI family TRAP transporter solute-binding subunit [Lachnospira multipara]|uniref:TAXI family TRAP transporter solute-binding subunit n=1 Tax=Lachnospira multipara TaxID=28051 RepID=UPI000480A844|nr:TAXI family TRAP transporter solute-binding subunit [Lachnospira multipara]
MRTFKKICACLVCMCLFLGTMTGCSQASQRMMFGTGGTSGTYYSYGGIIAQYMKNYADVKAVAVSTGGSKVNIQSIHDGDFQLAFTQSDVMTYAWEGTRAFENDGATTDFRVLASLYSETVQIITMDDSITSVEDLKGKRVSIGQAGSGVYFNAIDILSAAGIDIDDIKPQYQSFEDSKEALKDGRIDAAFIVSGTPTTAITELATTNGVNLISIDEELQEKILSDYSYYKAYTIPAGTYPDQDEDIQTVAVEATLIVSADVDEETVYNLTAAIFDHVEEIKLENSKGGELTLESATDITTVPYHAGAAKYFAEKGYTVNTDEN